MKKMKSFTLIVLSIFTSLIALAQNTADQWTKDSKTDLANECKAVLSAKYSNVPEDQRDDVAICYANAIVTAYPKRTDWINKMEIEVKKIKAGALEQCIKSNGVEAPKAQAIKVDSPKAAMLSKEALIGMW